MHPLSHRKQFEMMNRDVAQLVSAPALGAGGPPFESEYPDKSGKEPERDFRFFFYIQKCLSGRRPNGHFAVQKSPAAKKVPGFLYYLSGRRLHQLFQQVSHAYLLVNSLVKFCNWNSLLLHGVAVT